jgi:hypothetical protein
LGRGRIEHGRELLELVGVQAEKDLIQHHGLSAVASRFEHEVRAVLAKQAGRVIDQITLFGQGPQIDGGVTHWPSYSRIHNRYTHFGQSCSRCQHAVAASAAGAGADWWTVSDAETYSPRLLHFGWMSMETAK